MFAGHLQAQTPRGMTNSIGMKLVLLPAGTFVMGSPEDEEGAGDDENQHEVTISKEYYLGVHEVTQGQFEKLMGGNPSYFQAAVLRKNDASGHPVERVTWDDAVEFCQRLSELPEEKKAGRIYRLPTEAEWEYESRAGSRTAYSFGQNAQLLGDYAWYSRNSDRKTHPVGEKKPNAWGLYDMQGNAWEWCSDWYGEYPEKPVTDPSGPTDGTHRTYRGGSWDDGVPVFRSADRHAFAPSFGGVNGFRVAMRMSESSSDRVTSEK